MIRLLRGLPGNVVVLGLVSLLTDISSEMIYPLLPLFLATTLGAGPAFLGIIEGVAESTSALLKLYSGVLADRVRSRKRLVLAGYGISALARPLVAFAGSATQLMFIRFVDRTGKGVRTSPRDALIADTVDGGNRGLAFGFHRAMDHAGALIGPLLASLLLYTVTKNLRTVFLLSAIPGILAVILIAAKVTESSREPAPSAPPVILGRLPGGRLRSYLLILFLFTLGNSSDAFLLLKASQAGVPTVRIAQLWAFFHLVKMLAVIPFGALSDRIGRRSVIIAGWTVYALAYAGFALATSEPQIWGLFAVYGLFYGFTEGTEKAYISDLAPQVERGRAFGWFNFAVGAGALPASLIFGVIWQRAGSSAAFLFGALLAAIAAILLVAIGGGKETRFAADKR
ncbi:putative MFS-type transporter [Geobacter sp. OR-1]|uniref:MFS transporter n=1 Tax=Geobacter sp. OR-1 TaxID=1266765 RepID=UPI000541BD95|nr:MFS transporter [Geobacter sp. OR-1]GAM09566.1 putative MFS-type transporter [Geobacter sp. OR-1]